MQVMGQKSEKLDAIETVTLGHYNQHAEAYWYGTKDHDVSQNYTAFLAPFPKDKILDILDLGCGPGRDVKHFQSLGHRPVGLDGCEVFCRMARQYTGCQILQQTFLNLDLMGLSFDGIFANASLFHVPSQELPRVLFELYSVLRPEGIFFYPTHAVTAKVGQAKDMGITHNWMPARFFWKRRALK